MQVTWGAPTGSIASTVLLYFTIRDGYQAPVDVGTETITKIETTVPESHLIERNHTPSLHTLAIFLLKQNQIEKNLRRRGLNPMFPEINIPVHQAHGNLGNIGREQNFQSLLPLLLRLTQR